MDYKFLLIKHVKCKKKFIKDLLIIDVLKIMNLGEDHVLAQKDIMMMA